MRKIADKMISEKRKAGMVQKKALQDSSSSFRSLAQEMAAVPSYRLEKVVIEGSKLKGAADYLKSYEILLEEVLGASQASLYREYKKADIGIHFKDNLISLLRIFEKGVQAFEIEDDFRHWLTSRVENLGNQRPMDLLSLESGRREVEQAIDRVEYGVYG